MTLLLMLFQSGNQWYNKVKYLNEFLILKPKKTINIPENNKIPYIKSNGKS